MHINKLSQFLSKLIMHILADYTNFLNYVQK